MSPTRSPARPVAPRTARTCLGAQPRQSARRPLRSWPESQTRHRPAVPSRSGRRDANSAPTGNPGRRWRRAGGFGRPRVPRSLVAGGVGRCRRRGGGFVWLRVARCLVAEGVGRCRRRGGDFAGRLATRSFVTEEVTA